MSIGKTNAITITGGEMPPPVTGEFRVRYFDIDGTILKTEWVNSGQNATPPNNPNYDSTYLVFDRWNASSNNITYNKDIGAIYNTVNGKTYVFVNLKGLQDLTIALLFTKFNNDTLTVEWGDGTSNTFTNNGTFNTGNHTYTQKGEYVIMISINGTGTYQFGQGGYTTPLMTYDKRAAYKLYVGSSGMYNLLDYCFYQHYLAIVSIPHNITSIGGNAFSQINTIKHLSFPDRFSETPRVFLKSIKSFSFGDNITSIGDATFKYTTISEFNPLKNITSIGVEAFTDNITIEKIDIPSTTTTIKEYAFSNLYNCTQFIFRKSTPPTLYNINVFQNINQNAKIFVPDTSVAAYKAATNWSTYADYIYPLSDIE